MKILKALIFLEDQEVSQSVKKVLCSSGWDASIENHSADILSKIKPISNAMFSLTISGLMVNGTSYMEFNKTVEKFSPFTQRMVIASKEENKELINAINSGNIHACVTYPFLDKDLISQAETCKLNFERETINQQFKRLISRQNKQLFSTAKKFKTKEKQSKRLITRKKAKLASLRAKKRQADDDARLNVNISLEQYISHKGTALQQDSYLQEFIIVKSEIDNLIHSFTSGFSNDFELAELDSILKQNRETEFPDLIDSIKKCSLIHSLGMDLSTESPGMLKSMQNHLDDYIDLIISEDKVTAQLILKKEMSNGLFDLSVVLEYLRHYKISYGIVEDDKIQQWLNSIEKEPFIIAVGKAPVYSKEAHIEYMFSDDYQKSGKLNKDGSIDFRDRGDVPYIEKGNLLAKKIPPEKGISGINVFSDEILVNAPSDPLFTAGFGTVASEDGSLIFSAQTGQPHVDIMGVVTINPEMVIEGDVDYNTGNINFNGNVIVRGAIRDGFHVKGTSLTVNEIDGGTIDLTGDLNVSNGMTNTTIIAVGNIYTKFINNCTILGFGTFTVLKEIIDSTIILGGRCDISSGHIIASNVSAKGGIQARNVGTISSRAPVLRVGFNDHIKKLEDENNEILDESLQKIKEYKNNINMLTEKTTELHQRISEQAFEQDRAIVDIRKYKKNIPELKASGNTESLQRVISSLKSLKNKETQAEIEVNRLFERQDQVETKIEKISDHINDQEKKNIKCMKQKKKLEECMKIGTSDPVVIIGQTITQGTKIVSKEASLILKETLTRSTIRETMISDGILDYYKLQISSNT